MTTTETTNEVVKRPDTVALVTGGNKGLGRETVRRLAELGWTVLLGARDAARGQATADELTNCGDVRFMAVDVTSQESVDAAAAQVNDRFGRLDVLVNNAGIIGGRNSVEDTAATDFLACYAVNLLGPVRMTHAFLRLLQLAENPRIVMVSSGMGSLTVTSDPERGESSIHSLVYPSSKAALNMVTTQYAKALHGIKVNAADPGYTATDLNNRSGFQTVTQGTDAIVRLATLGPDGPTGGFFDRTGPVPW